jgi:hypothetical protein
MGEPIHQDRGVLIPHSELRGAGLSGTFTVELNVRRSTSYDYQCPNLLIRFVVLEIRVKHGAGLRRLLGSLQLKSVANRFIRSNDHNTHISYYTLHL